MTNAVQAVNNVRWMRAENSSGLWGEVEICMKRGDGEGKRAGNAAEAVDNVKRIRERESRLAAVLRGQSEAIAKQNGLCAGTTC